MFDEAIPTSLLDVGCGLGVWAKAAMSFGIKDVMAVDGGEVEPRTLVVPRKHFRRQLLDERFSLGRRFDVAICLEVGEHLHEKDAGVLIENLVNHADLIYFSAACPGQPGDGHVNCQWPEYWQKLFNAEGYVCDDAIRWKLWSVTDVGFVYRQNLLLARRDPLHAGREPRIRPVVHPELVDCWEYDASVDRRSRWLRQVEQGSETISWYVALGPRALSQKLYRRLFRR
jgi:SAM-dependent methyltransferase